MAVVKPKLSLQVSTCHPNIRTEIPGKQRIIKATTGRKLVIGGDLNTRSTLWFDKKEDARSPMLQEFITLNDLDILNQRVFPPTLQNSRGQSYIDLTLTTQAATTYISNWEVLESLAMSDHKAIAFTFRTNPCDDDTPPPVQLTTAASHRNTSRRRCITGTRCSKQDSRPSPALNKLMQQLNCYAMLRPDVAGASPADLTGGRMRSSGIRKFIWEKRRSFTETGTPRMLTISTRKWLLHGTDLRENELPPYKRAVPCAKSVGCHL
jgi:hypothetical protein